VLLEVRIENLAVIDELEVHFDTGFTAVTGETGAGKSLLMQALGLIAGDRASTEAIRGGADRALIEARLRLADPAARARLADEGYGEPDDADIVVRRILQADGQHRVYVNGRLATAQLLQDVVGAVLEIHAQHAQQRLLDPEAQLVLIDEYAGLGDESAGVRGAWGVREAAAARLAELETSAGDRDRELEWLRFQLREFDDIKPVAGELVDLQAQLQEAEGQAALGEAAAAARELLVDGEGSALDRLFGAEDLLRRASRLAPRLTPLADALRTVAETVRQQGQALARLDGAEVAEDISGLRDRVAALERLARRHGGDFEHALAQWDGMRSKLDDLEALDERIGDARRILAEADAAWHARAAELSDKRRAAGVRLAADVETGLHSLDMPRAVFAVAGWGEGRPGPRGIDRIEFRLAANPGDEPRAVRKVASGGELSRILLAIQGAVGQTRAAQTVVFDEVDTGIGGETAVVVGRRMRALGETAQVFAVTHTPQVAASAHRQIHLRKDIVDGRAATVAVELDGEAREAEIARMLGARDRGTARDHARSLLQTAAETEHP
jgi:DNA repair protein RecN (Recombination protein N)